MKKPFFGLILSLLIINGIEAQEVTCPAIWGIAKMTFLVSDMQVARNYYGKFLGFDEAFSYSSGMDRITSFKVNDRQFLEFVTDKDARRKTRLVSLSLETENVGNLLNYLRRKGMTVPDQTSRDGAGNEVFSVRDLSGNQIEFIQFNDSGLHMKSKGRFLSEKRISERIHHAGLYAKTMNDQDPFYAELLDFKEILRYPDDKTLPATIIYFAIGNGTECIEHYLTDDLNFSHPCLYVKDMQQTIITLKNRKTTEIIGNPVIGKGRRWLLNLSNEDGTKVEFTEPYCVR